MANKAFMYVSLSDRRFGMGTIVTNINIRVIISFRRASPWKWLSMKMKNEILRIAVL